MTEASALVEVNDYIDAGLVHSLHCSELRSFRKCRQAWAFRYRDGYHAIATVPAFEFGTAYHAAMENYYDPEGWHLPHAVRYAAALAEFERCNDSQLAAYQDAYGPVDSETAADYAQRLELGRGMLRYYLLDVAPRIDDFVPRKAEIAFEVPIPDDGGSVIWCKCERCFEKWYHFSPEVRKDGFTAANWNGLPLTLGGRIDLLVETHYGAYRLIDWKTASRLTLSDFSLSMDDQIDTYLLAMRLLGIQIEGYIYHEQLKAMAQEPTPMTRRYRGRLFSTSRANVVDYEKFLAAVQEHDPGALAEGLYDSFLKYLQEGPQTYTRRVVTRTDAELEATRSEIVSQWEDMMTGRVYRTPTRNCDDCSFRGPCLAMKRGEDPSYDLATNYTRDR